MRCTLFLKKLAANPSYLSCLYLPYLHQCLMSRQMPKATRPICLLHRFSNPGAASTAAPRARGDSSQDGTSCATQRRQWTLVSRGLRRSGRTFNDGAQRSGQIIRQREEIAYGKPRGTLVSPLKRPKNVRNAGGGGLHRPSSTSMARLKKARQRRNTHRVVLGRVEMARAF